MRLGLVTRDCFRWRTRSLQHWFPCLLPGSCSWTPPRSFSRGCTRLDCLLSHPFCSARTCSANCEKWRCRPSFQTCHQSCRSSRNCRLLLSGNLKANPLRFGRSLLTIPQISNFWSDPHSSGTWSCRISGGVWLTCQALGPPWWCSQFRRPWAWPVRVCAGSRGWSWAQARWAPSCPTAALSSRSWCTGSHSRYSAGCHSRCKSSTSANHPVSTWTTGI